MKATTEEVRREFVQLWARLGTFWGVSSGTARVYGWLLTQPNGGDTDEIMAGLQMGRGTVSMACKELRDWELIHSGKVAGIRRLQHRVEADLAKVVRSIIRARKRREWDPILEMVRAWLPRLAGDRSPDAAVFAERLRAIAACVGQANLLAEQFLNGATLPGLELDAMVQAATSRKLPATGKTE